MLLYFELSEVVNDPVVSLTIELVEEFRMGSCTICVCVDHMQKNMDQPGKFANPARSQLIREN